MSNRHHSRTNNGRKWGIKLGSSYLTVILPTNYDTIGD
jgi:hypothetical protein